MEIFEQCAQFNVIRAYVSLPAEWVANVILKLDTENLDIVEEEILAAYIDEMPETFKMDDVFFFKPLPINF
jgi:hypothetical protein